MDINLAKIDLVALSNQSSTACAIFLAAFLSQLRCLCHLFAQTKPTFRGYIDAKTFYLMIFMHICATNEVICHAELDSAYYK